MKNISFRKQLLALSVLSLAAGTAQAAEITVSAAASLTNAFKEIAQRYEAKYPDAKVQLNFGASGALLQQMAKALRSTCLPRPTRPPWTRPRNRI